MRNSTIPEIAACLLIVVAMGNARAASRDAATLMNYGMCDASAGAVLDASTFVVANNDDNVLRIYRTTNPGKPTGEIDLNRFLQTGQKRHECDIEGAARVGDRIYWIGSHSRKKDGDTAPSRHRFFATRAVRGPDGPTVQPDGLPYSQLMDDLAQDPRFSPFKLRQAMGRAPDKKDALNIEGLGARPDGSLLIGFRNPIPGGRALLVSLLNPDDLIQSRPAKFGEPVLLDLKGHGVRDLATLGNTYLVVAGSRDGKGTSRLWSWAGGNSAPAELTSIHLKALNPEALLVFPEKPEGPWLILSDDGSREMNGTPCKDFEDPLQRSFRSVWITP